MRTCPPCHGNCNQGRDCPADAEPLDRDDWRDIACAIVAAFLLIGLIWLGIDTVLERLGGGK